MRSVVCQLRPARSLTGFFDSLNHAVKEFFSGAIDSKALVNRPVLRFPTRPEKFDNNFMEAKEFSTATVDNFVDYSPQCRADQPPVRVSANCLRKRQLKPLNIDIFQGYGLSLNWDIWAATT